jgi:hypothetical protein
MANKLTITERTISAKTKVPFVAVYVPIGGLKPEPIVLLVTEIRENQTAKRFRGTATVIKSPLDHAPGEVIAIAGPDSKLRRIDFSIEKDRAVADLFQSVPQAES